MNWLRNNLGFSDFRFDFAKGYSARFVMEYIQASWPKLSIGEYWDDCSYVGPDYALDYNQGQQFHNIRRKFQLYQI
jgi:alpha-amylase